MLLRMSDDEKTAAPPAPEDAASAERAGGFFFGKIFARPKKFFAELYDEIWRPAGTAARSAPMRIFATLWRVVEITAARTLSNRIPLQAAALTYYVLMALAPFVMLSLTIFAGVMNVRGEEAVATMKLRIAETMQLIAPETTEAEQHAAEAAAAAGTPAPATVAPELQEFANNLLESTMANSRSAGTIGFVVLVVLAVFMIARVEDAYNLMWNVKQGRSWGRRFGAYFLFLVFGGALTAVSASALSVSAVFRRISAVGGSVPAWLAALPGGEAFFGLMTSFVPTLAAILALTFAFACLHRYMPKTHVRWRPALVGGAFVALVFVGGHKLMMLYVNNFSEFNSIYGNLGVIFVLMFMLYLGWIFLLLGGQLSFAVQNALYLKNLNREWAELSPKSKQEAFFACLFAVYSAGARNAAGPTPSELSRELCIPLNHVLECIDVLQAQKLIVKLDEESLGRDGEACYNAAGTVPEMTVADLKKRFDNLRSPLVLGGNAELRAALERFSATFSVCGESAEKTTLKDLLVPAVPAASGA